MLNAAESPLSKLPVEDLLQLYLDTMREFILLKQKPYTLEEKEKIKDELKIKLKQLYANIGVDFENEIKKITK